MELTAVLTHAEEGGFVALNPETGTTTQGETVEETVANVCTIGTRATRAIGVIGRLWRLGSGLAS